MENLKIEETINKASEKYRSFLHDEAENTHWRHGGPPIYDAVNRLFEEGRTKVNLICYHDVFSHLSLYKHACSCLNFIIYYMIFCLL